MSKEKKFIVQIINIKLQTRKEGPEKTEAYKNLIRKLQINKVHEPISENNHLIIYNYYERATPIKQIPYIYGSLGKGIYFDKEEINSINLENLEAKKINPDRDNILASKTTYFIFLPTIHKFCIVVKNGINANNVYKFLKNALSKVAEKEDIVEVEIIKEPQITEEILNAFAIHYLDYSISYTNDDPTSSMDKLYDHRLKKLNIGEIGVKMKADFNGALNTDEPDELIEGGIKLAEQNGNINEAIITRKRGGIRETVSNKENPRKVIVQATDEDFKEKIVINVFNLFL